MGDEGLELRPVSKWKITDVVMGDAESDAFPDVHDRKLEALLQVWADLPESVKDALLVMVSDRIRQRWELPKNEFNDLLTKSKNLPPSGMLPMLKEKGATIRFRRSSTQADVHYELRRNCLRAKLLGP